MLQRSHGRQGVHNVAHGAESHDQDIPVTAGMSAGVYHRLFETQL